MCLFFALKKIGYVKCRIVVVPTDLISKQVLYTGCTVHAFEHGNMKLKVNGYTFRGSNSVSFIIASHINWGHLIKERICSHWSKFFPL